MLGFMWENSAKYAAPRLIENKEMKCQFYESQFEYK